MESVSPKQGILKEELATLRAKWNFKMKELDYKMRNGTEISDSDRLSADNAYLVRHLGDALSLAISDVVEKRPADPISFLSCCLRKYAEDKRKTFEEDVRKLEMELILEEQNLVREERKVQRIEEAAYEKENERRKMLYVQREQEMEASLSASPRLSEGQLDHEDGENNQTPMIDEPYPSPTTRRRSNASDLYTIKEDEKNNKNSNQTSAAEEGKVDRELTADDAEAIEKSKLQIEEVKEVTDDLIANMSSENRQISIAGVEQAELEAIAEVETMDENNKGVGEEKDEGEEAEVEERK
ncbi:DgyrCDS3893 [Dimorphilus gyrociliatus]|uniref:DgyrCDS3893 n=1 Tax=Dimorphilus gyrociliatus TaxID=2664684 RepID=A0A7I8VF91_9ANNE|nr:DgyrCDS3893 [Dimorphilus gyrociliatus]